MRPTALVDSTRILALLLVVVGCGSGNDLPSVSNGGSPLAGEEEIQCHRGDRVVVTIIVDAPGERVYGEHTRLRYPATVQIPGHADDTAVIERVTFVLPLPHATNGLPEETFANGSTVVNDEDTDFDGVDDRLQALLSSPFTPFADGRFVDVAFDCVETIPWPSPDLFACDVASVVDLDLQDVAPLSSCHVVVAPAANQ